MELSRGTGMQKQLFALIMSAGLALAGCSSFQPETYSCDYLLTAPADGVRVTLRTLDTGKAAEARFNGVSARCEAKDDTIEMDIKAGLTAKRSVDDIGEVAPAEIPIIIAILDEQDNLVRNESTSYRVAFDTGVAKLYPVANFSVELPIGGRVVISLAPEVLE